MAKAVYYFGDGEAAGSGDDRNLLGGKGAGLAEMTRLGLPVPPGFTISTEACVHYFRRHEHIAGLKGQVRTALNRLERTMGRRFGDPDRPLLLSVRSGARVSMPGMMDTVLNLGLNDRIVEGLAQHAPRFAWDSYRRFIQMYGDVVLGVPHSAFETALSKARAAAGVTLDTQLDAEQLRALTATYQRLIVDRIGRTLPAEPLDQLWGAIDAVFSSWDNERARTYRRMEGYSDDWGTAVNVQAMVFGNMGDTCATGVAFTRDPRTGERRFYGEYLVNAQGEDVVAGIRDARPINGDGADTLEALMPGPYAELDRLEKQLETHYRDMQDIEFTIEDGRLFLLQTRTGKRTAAAALRIAVDMVDEGLITIDEAMRRVTPQQIETLLHPRLDPEAPRTILTTGLGASPGAASGRLAFSAADAIALASTGPVILVRTETSPEDIAGMEAALGVVTARGGATSHAAVVARGMGRTAVVGCGGLDIDEAAGRLTVGERTLERGDWITLEGTQGWVLEGPVPTIPATTDGRFQRLMSWADERRRLGVRANADNGPDAATARRFGAEGVGLCRTEHMFFEHIQQMRRMILATNDDERAAALAELLPIQQADFEAIFEATLGAPVTIRLLDPPLHEFLPHGEAEVADLAHSLEIPVHEVQARVAALEEANPMLGHRGCRLAVSYPAIARMQTEAIIRAAIAVKGSLGLEVHPEIMIPLVGMAAELKLLRAEVVAVADALLAEADCPLKYAVGTMIELPRAAVTADEIAQYADFFSFGTNDLTQTTFGISRDDSAHFLPVYLERGILPGDPFASIDPAVGRLVEMAAEAGRRTRPTLKLGVCGEHGGDPASVRFFHRAGLDYVSCSPFRVPVARLAAAHAAMDDAD